MKQTYINPVLKVVKIQTMQMVASSPQLGIGTSGSASDAESREDDFDWEEEE